MANIFSSTPSPKIPRAKFDLSHEIKLDADAGQIIPIGLWETVPGDSFKIGAECVIRTIPMKTPMLQEVNAYVHYFYVPYRILVDDQEDWTVFFTGGKDGLETAAPLPKWNPTSSTSRGDNGMPSGSAMYSLWDYFGFPVGLTNFTSNGAPLSFPKRAYNSIWNWFYRDENRQDEVDWDSETIQFRNIQKDYFSSALPWIVKGSMPTIPMSGTLSLQQLGIQQAYVNLYNGGLITADMETATNRDGYIGTKTDSNGLSTASTSVFVKPNHYTNLSTNDSKFPLNNVSALGVNLGDAVKVKLDDLRNLLAQERWLQTNALCGTRYDEFLLAHYGTAPRSEVLDQPQYIGGVKMPMIISEVAQTSSTDSTTPQGNLTGNGLTASSQHVGSYKCKEFGLIIGLLSVLPTQSYFQGIPRAWLKEDRFDFYTPEFANLDSQAVWNEEIYATAASSFNSADIFGYQGRFDELRYLPSRICGGFRTSKYDDWHMARKFDSAPALNGDFLSAKYYSTQDGKRVFTIQEDDFTTDDAERTLLINFRNIISAVRPLPYMAK